MLRDPRSVFSLYILEPLREIYEAFVIYTFFTLLTDLLGGERNIIINTSGREPVRHSGLLKYVFPDVDTSDPHAFLLIKRGILQYVWLKPFLCFGYLISDVLGISEKRVFMGTTIYFWLTIAYNISVTLSLYFLAMFWKVLWNDLKPFKPVGKFLCVKLIIFASYWQGVLLAILNYFGVLPQADDGNGTNIGIYIQNALLCVEMVPFAIGHWFSFSYKPFTISELPYGRLKLRYALRDMFGIKDLLYDFKLTFWGDYYKDYKRFDSVEALIAHPKSKGRMSRINQGLRYHSNQTPKYWIPQNVLESRHNSITQSTSEENALSNSSFVSNGSSVRGIYLNLPPNSTKSPPGSPSLTCVSNSTNNNAITNALNTLDLVYDKEHLDEDELYYALASKTINNFKLGEGATEKLINYPIVFEIVNGHMFGFKVKKLRKNRLLQQSERLELSHVAYNANRYGSTS